MKARDSIVVESKNGEIAKEFVKLNASKEDLHNRIGILLDRLQDVLGEPEESPDGCSNKETLTSQFAIDLSSITGTIETDLEKIDDILNRLEL